MLAELNSDSIQTTMMELQQYQRCAYFGNRDAAQYVASKMQQVGLQNVMIDSFYVDPTVNGQTGMFVGYVYNVRGFIPGHATADSVVLVGAHYDKKTLDANDSLLNTIAGGADDNAAGVALMLEVARVLTTHNFSPLNTVEFIAFDAFEFDMAGSVMDVMQRAANQEKVKLMLNNDRVAYDPQNMHMMTVLWYENAMQERSDAALMFDNFSQLLPIMMDVAGNLPESQNGDSYLYAAYGMPSVFFRETTLSPYHHTENDMMETCNLSNVVELAKVNMTMIIHYAYHDVFSLPDGVSSYAKNNLQIAPNPTTGDIRIDLSSFTSGEKTVEVLNAQGQKLSAQKVDEAYPTISLQSYPAGLYFVKVYDQDQLMGTSKILKW